MAVTQQLARLNYEKLRRCRTDEVILGKLISYTLLKIDDYIDLCWAPKGLHHFAMEAIIFIGIQATGKSTFFKHSFFRTHVRINLDMLKTRHREKLLLQVCFEMKQSFVVDNTNPEREDRKRYILPAKEKKFKVIGYYFNSEIKGALKRNRNRPQKEFIPEKGIRGTHSRVELPDYQEGFDELFYVYTNQTNGFDVKKWEIEI